MLPSVEVSIDGVDSDVLIAIFAFVSELDPVGFEAILAAGLGLQVIKEGLSVVYGLKIELRIQDPFKQTI